MRITRTGHVISWENADVFSHRVTAGGIAPENAALDYRLRNEHNGNVNCGSITYQMVPGRNAAAGSSRT